MANQPQQSAGAFSRYQGEQVNSIPPGYIESMGSIGQAYANFGKSIADAMQYRQEYDLKKKEVESNSNTAESKLLTAQTKERDAEAKRTIDSAVAAGTLSKNNFDQLKDMHALTEKAEVDLTNALQDDDLERKNNASSPKLLTPQERERIKGEILKHKLAKSTYLKQMQTQIEQTMQVPSRLPEAGQPATPAGQPAGDSLSGYQLNTNPNSATRYVPKAGNELVRKPAPSQPGFNQASSSTQPGTGGTMGEKGQEGEAGPTGEVSQPGAVSATPSQAAGEMPVNSTPTVGGSNPVSTGQPQKLKGDLGYDVTPSENILSLGTKNPIVSSLSFNEDGTAEIVHDTRTTDPKLMDETQLKSNAEALRRTHLLKYILDNGLDSKITSLTAFGLATMALNASPNVLASLISISPRCMSCGTGNFSTLR